MTRKFQKSVLWDLRDPEEAFEEAIAAGRLSANPNHPLYALNYMYMGHGEFGAEEHGRAQFKHCDTRRYIP